MCTTAFYDLNFPSICEIHHHHHHHHHHVHEGLGVFPVPWSSSCSWSFPLFLGRSTFLRPFGLYYSACFGTVFVSVLCTSCSHFFCYCFISFTMLCAPVFSLIHWFFSLSIFVIPSKCLKNFICAASKRRSSLFLSIWKYIFENIFFSKICLENVSLIKIQQEWRVLYLENHINLWHSQSYP